MFGEKLIPVSNSRSVQRGSYISSTILGAIRWLSMVTSMLEKAFDTIPDGTGTDSSFRSGWRIPAQALPKDLLEDKGVRQRAMSRKRPTAWTMPWMEELLRACSKQNCFTFQDFEHPWIHFQSRAHGLSLLTTNHRRIKLRAKGPDTLLQPQHTRTPFRSLNYIFSHNFWGALHFDRVHFGVRTMVRQPCRRRSSARKWDFCSALT